MSLMHETDADACYDDDDNRSSSSDSDESDSTIGDTSTPNLANIGPICQPSCDSILVEEFRQVIEPQGQDESAWYGPWTSLLVRFFPYHDGFQIAPQYLHVNINGEPERRVFFLVKVHGGLTVCVIEVKPPQHLDYPSERIDAYKQMKNRLRSCINTPTAKHIQTIYGLSCIGDRFFVMSMQTARAIVMPPLNKCQDYADVAPMNWWRYKVLTSQGWARLTQLAQDVRASLHNDIRLHANSVKFVQLSDDSDSEDEQGAP